MKYGVPFLLLLLVATSAQANAQVAVELRAGAAIGNHLPAAAGLETSTRPSLAASVEVSPLSFLSLYGTYVRSAFGCQEGFCEDRDVTVTTSGVGAGGRLHLPRLPWVRAGVVHLATSVAADDGDHTIPAGPAFDLGTGLTLRVGGVLELLPGITYRAHFAPEDRTTTLSAELGVLLGF